MTMRYTCVVCNAPTDPYGGETRCDRCKQPCHVCGGNVALCQHSFERVLRAGIERDLRFTLDLQRKRA